MNYRTLLVTGSSTLIGSEVAKHFDALGPNVDGVDNNQRTVFFGPQGDIRWNQKRLTQSLRSFTHDELRGEALSRLQLKARACPRRHSLPRRVQVDRAIPGEAVQRRGPQPRRRPGQQLLDPGGAPRP